jgi:hypothetical protein
MERTHDMWNWDGFTWHGIHSQFQKEWVSQWKVITGIYRHTDRRRVPSWEETGRQKIRVTLNDCYIWGHAGQILSSPGKQVTKLHFRHKGTMDNSHLYWMLPSSGIWCRVIHMRADVSGEGVAHRIQARNDLSNLTLLFELLPASGEAKEASILLGPLEIFNLNQKSSDWGQLFLRDPTE